MNYLMDTHVLLWWLTDDPRLGIRVRELLSTKPIWCSVVTPWEIAVKETLGKIELPPEFDEALGSAGFIRLDVSFDHIKELRTLPLLHKDPFDRLLIAQSISEELILITDDHQIHRYNLPAIRASG